jgi:hypothetical protein
MSLVYHLVPRNLEGHTLYPLNQLKDSYPALYEAHLSKYEGREFLLTTKIPLLDCLWNDVLHFSPVHPAKIRDAMLALGQAWQVRQAFVIDTKAMNFTAQNTVYYFSGKTLKERLYEPFEAERLETMRELPEATLEYYKRTIEEGTRPLLFAHVPHILHFGHIQLADVEIIQVD